MMIAEAIAQITPSSIILFFLYTMVALLAALVAKISIGNMGDKAKNQAVAAVTLMVTDAVKESRELSVKLLDERDKRARLEGKVDTIMNQATEEKRRADTAHEKLAKQNQQIENLGREVNKLTSDVRSLRERLNKAEAEKKALEEEKAKLQNQLSTQGEDYRKLMDSVQAKIDKAVAEVKEELRLQYEKLISDLNVQIQARDEEIKSLQALLKEKESHEEETTVASGDVVASSQLDSADIGTGSDGSATDPDAGSSDNPGGSSSA
jgi:chromosome segregation ATPase